MSNEMKQSARETLFDCQLGKRYVIARCSLDDQVKNRLYEMGLVPATCVTVVKRAPLGDPLEITLRGYSLCVRGAIAKSFYVEEEPD